MGKLDLIAEFSGVWSEGPWEGRPVGRLLLDLKTSRSGIWPETALQLQAYRFAETVLEADGSESPMVPVDGIAAVHIRADGYDVIPFDVGDDPDTCPVYAAFLAARTVGGWMSLGNDPPSKHVRLDAARPPRTDQ